MGRVISGLAALLPLAAIAPGLAAASPGPGAATEVELARATHATADFGNARLSGSEHRLAVRGASVPAGEAWFGWALDYAYQRYEYSGLPSRNRDLHRLELPLSWQGEGVLAWHAEFKPVVATSSNVFQEIWSRGSSDDFMWHGRVVADRAPVGRGWGWRLGAARDDAFGEERVYPTAALLRQHEGVRTELGWPVSRAMRAVGRGIEMGGPAESWAGERRAGSCSRRAWGWSSTAAIGSRMTRGRW